MVSKKQGGSGAKMATAKKTTEKTATKETSSTAEKTTDVSSAADSTMEENTVDPNMIKKKDIYDHVSVSTGLRKRDVREAVDSMLEFMHSSLSNGKTVQVPPLGKIKSVERGSGDNLKVHYKLMLKKTDDTEKKAG
jgi:DNA-binding protein HU-alpha